MKVKVTFEKVEVDLDDEVVRLVYRATNLLNVFLTRKIVTHAVRGMTLAEIRDRLPELIEEDIPNITEKLEKVLYYVAPELLPYLSDEAKNGHYIWSVQATHEEGLMQVNCVSAFGRVEGRTNAFRRPDHKERDVVIRAFLRKLHEEVKEFTPTKR